MADKNRNALAELAEELNRVDAHEPELWVGHRKAVRKAQRIVAELAKADAIYAKDPVTNNCVTLQLNAFSKCREIAEEGGAT